MSDREKLIDLLEPHMSGNPCEHESGTCELANCQVCNAGVLADHLISNGVTVQKWIPVSEPPKEPMEYIVMIKGGANATTLLYDDKQWFEEDAEGWRTYYAVTHWMSFPAPPKDGD